MAKTVNGTTTKSYLDGPEVALEVTGTQTTLYLHERGLDELLASYVGTTPTFYHQDALGSVIALTDGAGAIIRSTGYEPFGSLRGTSGVTSPWGFTGRLRDAESGLVFLRNRYYDSQSGRFTTPDPIGIAGGVNLYAYVRNNPLNTLDPWGLCELGRCPSSEANSSDSRGGDVVTMVIPSPYGSQFIHERTDGSRYWSYSPEPTRRPPTHSLLVDVITYYNDPGRILRTIGGSFSAFGHPIPGRTMGIGGLVLEPGGTGKIVGIAAGGTAGVWVGSSVGPIGAIAGGIVGGTIGGAIGSRADDPGTGYLNYGE